MNKILSIIVLLTSLLLSAQEKASVEKSVTGVQIGLFGTEFYNEAKLSDQFALRSEASLNPAIFGGSFYSKTGFIFYPEISLIPKYYYNLNRRLEKGKNIKNNSGNYLALDITYTPDWFVISNYDNIQMSNILTIIPTYGIRRNFAKNFNYEAKFGLGYGTNLDYKDSGAAINLSFKIGYDF